jgi:hypothetical protein
MRVFQRIYSGVNKGPLFFMDKEVARRIKLLRLVHRLVDKKMAHALRQMLIGVKHSHVPQIASRRSVIQKQQHSLNHDGHTDELRLIIGE